LQLRPLIRSVPVTIVTTLIVALCAGRALAQTNIALAVPQPIVTASQPGSNGQESASRAASSPAAAPRTSAELLEPGPRLVWNPRWPPFRAIGYGLIAASIAGAIAVTLLIPNPDEPRWVGGIIVDTAVRKALRARSPGLRDGIRVASDFTLVASIVQVGLIDGFLIPAVEGSWYVAWQLTLMNAQAFALNTVVGTLLYKAVARARPAYAGCARDRYSDPLCDTGSFASFPSSHTSTAFTAAGLTCIHHKFLPLYGGDPWDSAACAGSVVIASATGLFRVVGDRHYLSDVVLGAAFGFSLGYLYPYLFHYQYGEDKPPSNNPTAAWGFVPGAQQTPYGVSMLGMF
jgi:membrane-associated phospholipid phosphatase